MANYRWQEAEPVGSGNATACSMALDSGGIATVVCPGWSRRSTGREWGEAASTEAGYRRQIATDELGSVIAVWTQDGQLWSSRFTPIGTWSESERIGVGGDDAHLAVGPQGIAMVVWSTTDGLWWNRFTPSGGWRTAEPIDDTSGAYLPKVAVDADGDAKLVWARSNEIWSSDYR